AHRPFAPGLRHKLNNCARWEITSPTTKGCAIKSALRVEDNTGSGASAVWPTGSYGLTSNTDPQPPSQDCPFPPKRLVLYRLPLRSNTKVAAGYAPSGLPLKT